MALTQKQKLFIDEYLIDLNATQAAIRAGYSPNNADKIGSELLGKTRVSDAIKTAMAERSKRTGVNADRVVQELAKIAFVNATKVIDPKTAMVREDALPEDTAAIQSVKVKTFGEDGLEREIKMADKLKALELLGAIWGCLRIRWSCLVAWIPKRPNWMTFLSRCVVVGNECGEIAAVG